jgi:hypothetical protein
MDKTLSRWAASCVYFAYGNKFKAERTAPILFMCLMVELAYNMFGRNFPVAGSSTILIVARQMMLEVQVWEICCHYYFSSPL